MPELLYERIKWDVDDAIARVTLARGSGNALDMATAQGIREAAERVRAGATDGSIRVAVLAAEGTTFCVGGDLREFAGAADRGTQVVACADELHAAILTLRAACVPIVSVIQGTVAGGGIGLALAADIVLMASEATMRLAYTAAGLSPDCGSTWLLAQRIGIARALDLALTNRAVSGSEAARCGLVSRSVPAGDLDREVAEVVSGLRAGSADAYAQTKRLIAAAPHRDLAAQLDDEAATIGKLIVGADGIEGVDAFLEKRAPSFG
jgi:2-(1,2-epoxy-1,2-dihydrophenyl)acetyl-CoA isomerase